MPTTSELMCGCAKQEFVQLREFPLEIASAKAPDIVRERDALDDWVRHARNDGR